MAFYSFIQGSCLYHLVHSSWDPKLTDKHYELLSYPQAGRVLCDHYLYEPLDRPRFRGFCDELGLGPTVRSNDEMVLAWLGETFDDFWRPPLRLYRARAVAPAPAAPTAEGEDKAAAARGAGPWIEIALVDQDGEPVAGIVYELTFADGSSRRGRLGRDGRAHVTRLPDRQSCLLSFPELDGTSWSAD